jgi:hypothetical protein
LKTASSRHYKKLLARATKQVTLYSPYSRGVVPARDLWMVKRSDICPAVFCGDHHGVGSPTATFKVARSLREQAKLDARKGGFALLKRQNLPRCQKNRLLI